MPSRKHPEIEPLRSVAPGQINRVAIIGGGASGAISLDSLVQEDQFEQITLFERRNTLGGIWVYDKNPITTPNDLIKVGAFSGTIDPPLENPFKKQGYSARKTTLLPSRQQRFEQTPAYEKMNTNIIEKLMTYSDRKQWNPDQPNTYVDRAVVRQYIQDYIQKNAARDNVKIVMNTTVEHVERIVRPDSNTYYFTVTLRQTQPGSDDLWYQEDYDSVIVNVGHYHIPFIPKVPGSEAVQAKYPERIEHAKFFRTGDKYKDKVVVVVGARSLGADVCKYTADFATKVYQLIRTFETVRKVVKAPNLETKPVIDRYEEIAGGGFKVVFEDGSEVVNPDYVVYATGYQFLFPFLVENLGDITIDGKIVPDLYQHTFLTREPLLPFIGMPTDAISFRAFEYQAILVARFLAGRVELPPLEVQNRWLQDRYALHKDTRAFHTIGATDARNYMQSLVKLGQPRKGARTGVGREFPVVTEEDIKQYVAAAIELSKSWS